MSSHQLEICVIRNIKYNKDWYAKRLHFNPIEKLLQFLHVERKKHLEHPSLGRSILVLMDSWLMKYIHKYTHMCACVCA